MGIRIYIQTTTLYMLMTTYSFPYLMKWSLGAQKTFGGFYYNRLFGQKLFCRGPSPGLLSRLNSQSQLLCRRQSPGFSRFSPALWYHFIYSMILILHSWNLAQNKITFRTYTRAKIQHSATAAAV
jgi:hypothetical protein